MKLSIIIGMIGIIILGYSFLLEPYTNNQEFFAKYMKMGPGQSNEYFQLREEMLTPKYRLEDTGITLSLISIISLIILKSKKGSLLSPKEKYLVVALAITLPFLTIASYVFDLFIGMSRNEFPRWADSLGIPLMGVPIEFIALLIWSSLHLLFIKKYKQSPISSAITLKLNPWLIFVSAVTLLLTLIFIFGGQYWYAVIGALWIYYYLSVGVNRIYFKTMAKNI